MEPPGSADHCHALVFLTLSALGIDPISAVCVIVVVNMEIGMITPPVGLPTCS